MENQNSKRTFVVCVKNESYSASLELRKIYEVLDDSKAAEHHHVRVIDESGEDYLYPADYFMSIELPQTIEEALSLTT
jgi:primosomal protein N'